MISSTFPTRRSASYSRRSATCRVRSARFSSAMSAARRAAWLPTPPHSRSADSHFVMNVHARWREPAMDKACIEWARKLFEAASPMPLERPTSTSCRTTRWTASKQPMAATIAACGSQAPLRSAEPVPHEPERSACRMIRHDFLTRQEARANLTNDSHKRAIQNQVHADAVVTTHVTFTWFWL